MDLRDIAAGERDDRRLATVGDVRVDKNGDTRGLCLGESIGKASNLVTRYLASIGIRKMSVRNQHGHFAETGLDAHAAIGIVGPANLDARRLPVIRDNFAAREGYKVSNENVGALRGYVDPIFGDSLKLGVMRRGCVPIELHIDTARPRDDGIAANRILEWCHDDIS